METKHSDRYANILNPIVLPNGILVRNRLLMSAATNNHIQGKSADYPTDAMITLISNRAKNGAGIVVLTGQAEKYNLEWYHKYASPHWHSDFDPEGYPASDWFTFFDFKNRKNHFAFTRLSEEVHIYQSKIFMQILPVLPDGYDIIETNEDQYFIKGVNNKEISTEVLDELLEEHLEWAKYIRLCGFDGICVNCVMDLTIPARLFNNRRNSRTDKYGGSRENRFRWLVEYCKEVKKRCGKDFIVEVDLCAPSKIPGGFDEEELVALCQALDGNIDIIGMKGELENPSQDYHSPSSYSLEPYPTLKPAIQLKSDLNKLGIHVPVMPNGGFGDLDKMNQLLKDQQLDMISVCRAFIADENFGRVIAEGRGEDLVPCLRCNKCHLKSTGSNDYIHAAACSVNPWYGLEDRKMEIIAPPERQKKVAVIGGGPGGMRSALFAAARGHIVTIFEKQDKLGGLLNAVDGFSHKWTLTRYKNYLINQVTKNPDITVVLNADVTPGYLEDQDFNAEIISIGGTERRPDIPGIEYATGCIESMLERKELGTNVVIIGGGDISVDYAVQLARTGHNVFIIQHGKSLAKGSQIMHSYSIMMEAVEAEPTLTYTLSSVPVQIHEDSVEYTDGDGNLQTVFADSILYGVGMLPKTEEVVSLWDSAKYECFAIGDCKHPGDLSRVNRDAMGATCRL